MHSFVPALIAATLAAFVGAAPINAPVDLPAGVPSLPNLSAVSLPAGVVPPVGQVSAVEGELESVANAVNARNVVDDIINGVESEIPSGADRRATTLSIAVVFGNLLAEVQPYTEKLTYLVASNASVAEITEIVSSIKAPIVAAIPQIQALAGQEASVILAPVDGSNDLTVAQIASIVGGDVELILAAVGRVLNIVKAESGDIVTDVDSLLADLGVTVAELLGAVVPLVDGLVASLGPLLAPVAAIVSELGLGNVLAALGLNL